MKDEHKTKEQLIGELAEMQQRITELEMSEAGRKRAEEALRESEGRYRAFFEQAADSIVLIDVETGTLVEFNDRAHENLGYTREEFEKLKIPDFEVIESDKEVAKRIEKIIEEGADVFESKHRTKGGKVRDILVSARAISVRGRYFVQGIWRDITEHKRAEAALRESEEKFRSVVENSHAGIFIVNDAYQFTYVNSKLCQILGYPHEEIINQDFREFLDEESKHLVVDRYVRRQKGEEIPSRYEFDIIRKNGEKRQVEISSTVIADSEGNTRTVAQILDITERKRAGRLLEALNEAALAMEMALAPDEIFAAAAEKLRRLGFSCMLLLMDESQTRLFTKYIGVDARLVGAAEKLVGLKREDFSIPVENVDVYREVVWERKTVFVRSGEDVMRQIMPGPAKRFAGQLTRMVRFSRAIVAPVIVEDEVIGVFSVQSDDLIEDDVPAITALAYQVAAAWRKAQLLEQAQQEIAERVRAEAEREQLLVQIQEQAQRVQQIVDTVPEGVLFLDADERVVLANPLAEGDLSVLADAQVGDTLTHLGGRPLAELLTSPPKGLWHEVATDGRSFQVIARPIETSPTPSGWVLVIRDVTREREIERRVQQQERLATVGQLAAGIAHDFNNIMATIVLYARMLSQTEGLPTRGRERLATINQQARHATGLIQQILDFSRRSVLERRPLDLSPLLKEQIKMMERTLPENIQIGLTYGPADHTVNADPTRMQQIIMNLALNARDAMPKGGELRFGMDRIEVQSDTPPPLPEMEPGDWVQVTVSDTGIGIPPDVLPRIFDPFFTTKAPGKGSGLGLAQVHGIVAQHEGYIDVKSQAGQGTTFAIYLPALPVHPPEPPALETPPLATGRRETILVVEDDPGLRGALADTLELLNYRILTAENGQEALAVIERHGGEIALVLSDVVMPGMGGIALLHALRERGLTIGMVMMTGHPLEKELDALRTQGMTDYLLKPPSPEQLAEVVDRVLREGNQSDS